MLSVAIGKPLSSRFPGDEYPGMNVSLSVAPERCYVGGQGHGRRVCDATSGVLTPIRPC